MKKKLVFVLVFVPWSYMWGVSSVWPSVKTYLSFHTSPPNNQEALRTPQHLSVSHTDSLTTDHIAVTVWLSERPLNPAWLLFQDYKFLWWILIETLNSVCVPILPVTDLSKQRSGWRIIGVDYLIMLELSSHYWCLPFVRSSSVRSKLCHCWP